MKMKQTGRNAVKDQPKDMLIQTVLMFTFVQQILEVIWNIHTYVINTYPKSAEMNVMSVKFLEICI